MVAIGIILAVALLGLMAYGTFAQRKRHAAMQAYADKNGWASLPADDVTLNGYLPRYVQQLGQNNHGFDTYTRTTTAYDLAYRTTIGSHTLVLFQYQYTEYRQNADPQQPDHAVTTYFTILNVSMPVAEPTVLLLHHSFISKLADSGMHEGLQKISLEGDFNQYYDTYITPDSQVEALSTFTPDVMERAMAMADDKTFASMQMGGQSLIISFEKHLLTPEFIEPLLADVGLLLAKLDAKPHAYISEQDT